MLVEPYELKDTCISGKIGVQKNIYQWLSKTYFSSNINTDVNENVAFLQFISQWKRL